MTSTPQKPKQFQAIKGVRDILPPESALWNRVEQTACEVFGTFGFLEIRVPLLEQTDLFARSIGTETDIVSKEMFTFEDRPADVPNPRGKILTVEEMDALEDATRRGIISDSEQNVSSIHELRKVLDRLAQLDGTASNEASIARVKEHQRLIQAYVYLAQFVRLGDSLTLRPEATASVVRAYIEHGMQTLPGNVKL